MSLVALQPLSLRPGQAAVAGAFLIALLALLARLAYVLEFAAHRLFDVNLARRRPPHGPRCGCPSMHSMWRFDAEAALTDARTHP